VFFIVLELFVYPAGPRILYLSGRARPPPPQLLYQYRNLLYQYRNLLYQYHSSAVSESLSAYQYLFGVSIWICVSESAVVVSYNFPYRIVLAYQNQFLQNQFYCISNIFVYQYHFCVSIQICVSGLIRKSDTDTQKYY
jgi:hypothetical protein